MTYPQTQSFYSPVENVGGEEREREKETWMDGWMDGWMEGGRGRSSNGCV
jgi:hypothetical protein